MPTSFPTALDNFSNPTSGTNQTTLSHASQHANVNDAMEAVQAYLGTATAPGVAGGFIKPWSSAIGAIGYPKNTLVAKADGSGYWRNSVAGNTSNPDTGGAGWFDPFAGFHTVFDSGALPNVGGNQAASFNAAVAFSSANRIGNIKVPVGNWRLTDEVTLASSQGIQGENKAVTILTMEGAGNYGINVAGAGFGGSPTDGIKIDTLNLWGGKVVALLRVQGTGLFAIRGITAQNNSVGNVVRFTESQDGTFDQLDFLQVGGSNQADPAGGAIVYYGPACNNIYSRYARFEAPKNTAVYIDNANTIRYSGGKIDGSFGGTSNTANPWVYVSNGSWAATEYTVTGFRSYPMAVSGYGTIDYEGVVGNGLAPAIFTAIAPAYNLFLLNGGLPGVINRPAIKFRGEVQFSSQNTSGNIIGAVISMKAPDPRFAPNTGNDGRVQVSGAFDTGGGLYQAAFTEWKGTIYGAPTNNDRYVGSYIVGKASGTPLALITTQAAGLIQFRLLTGTVPNGDLFCEWDSVEGIRVDMQIKAPSYSQSRFTTRLAELKQTISVTADSYDTTSGLTTLQVAVAISNNTLGGCFVWDKVNDLYYYIVDNAGSQIYLLHDRTTPITATTYDVVLGNPKAGTGIAIEWT